ncbi:hypothetical protein GIY23_18750 [Allosaccharopolyspora coralli]|uniref:Uncharacterized protein n=1 Tax=Allosaccharopolyspora coralli TaxID=2665642 RepID=A0A5Q3QIK6_9PSEU|nr:hypothetical protein [Allosaccharopolyspora coralli]QGK71289.1 hypothetical protein GIY23_18750 [Allosaccharopolyspora coralli]
MPIPGPDTRVVELRVHGLLGNHGDKLTDSVASVDVAGDETGRIVRPADRLLRPVPGPMLAAGDRTVPRVVEGYVWGGMTPGGWSKATWALLFPFALANAAHWMLPPPRRDSAAGLALSNVLRALLRVASVLLTTLLVGQLTVVSVDLFAAQCLSPGTRCLSGFPDDVRELTVVRSLVGVVPVVLGVLVMHRLSTVTWRISGGGKPGVARDSAHAPSQPGANVATDPDTPLLRALHVVAAVSTVTLIVLGGPFAPDVDVRWWCAVVFAGVALLGAVLLDDPTEARDASFGLAVRARVATAPVRRGLMVAASLVLLSAVVAPGDFTGALPGSGGTIDLITGMLLITCVAVAVLLVPAALLARSRWADLPRPLRPWVGGWMAAPVLGIACLLGTGFGAGLALSARRALGHPTLLLPAAYDDVTIFWGTCLVLLAAAAAIAVPVVLFHQWRTNRSDDAVPDEVALLHAGRTQDQSRAARAWRRTRLQQGNAHHVVLLLAGLLALSTGPTLVLRLLGPDSASWSQVLVALGVGALAALAIALLRMVQHAATGKNGARYLGVLCDLTLFWPREAHPIVPPCYALKVIPELAARATEHLEDPDTRVVLVGHSQGSLLATVATARLLDSLPDHDRERVGLVTAGSQLQWAYPRAFPGVVPHDSLQRLAGSLRGRWRSLCRGTDPLGGPVTTWNRQVYDGMLLGVGFRPDGTRGPLPAATRGPTGALVLGGDHWLPDPQRGPFSFRRWAPGVLGHSQYSDDPEWDRAVAMAAGLEFPARGSTLPWSSAPPIPSAPEPERMRPHGSDGESLDVPAVPVQPAEPNGSAGTAFTGTVEGGPPVRKDRNAPWERGRTLRSPEH